MNWLGTLARRRVVALAIAGCAVAGCASSRPDASLEPVGQLAPDAERRAEALAHFAAGVSLELAKGIEASLPEYLEAFRLDPQYTALGLRMAGLFIAKKDFPKAIELLETAAKANPKSHEALLWLGLAYRGNDQPDKAVSVLQQAQKLAPADLGVTQALLETLLAQNALPDIAKLLEQARRQHSADAMFWARVGDLHANALKQKPALAKLVDAAEPMRCYEKASALSTNNPDILFRLAEAYGDTGNFEMAADAYAKLLKLRPETAQLRERIALSYVRAGQKDKATAVLEEIIRREPLRPEIYNFAGELYEEMKQDDRAFSNYQQSIVVNPNQLQPYLRASFIQLKAKRVDDALQTLATAREKNPRAFQVPYFTGLALSEKKEYAKAVNAFIEAETLAAQTDGTSKFDSSFYFYYGAACERSGDFDKAVALFQKSLQLDSENDAAANYLGYMWADKGTNLVEAVALIQRALAQEPDSGAYLDSLGWALFKMGRTEEALIHLRRAAELIKADPVIFEHLAEVMLKTGNRDEATGYLRRALEFDPGNKAIADKLRELEAGN
jgi:tetratricopeptide (TPR) repeat protein